MSGFYYQANIDIAKSFLEDNLHKVTQEQIKAVLSSMEKGETDFVKHQIEKGGKKLYLKLSSKPKTGFEKYDVVIETVGVRKEIINPYGETSFENIETKNGELEI